MKTKLILILLLALPVFVYAQELKPVKLPEPKMQGGEPLMQALKERKSMREFSSRELPVEVISDMLWGCGRHKPAGISASHFSFGNEYAGDRYLPG